MIYQFTAIEGPKINQTYTFPHEAGGGQRGGQMDESSVVKLDNKDGSYSMTGSSRLFVQSGRVEQQFSMDEEWYTQNPSPLSPYLTAGGNAFAARDAAIVDMIRYVVLGGNGRLTNRLVNGDLYWAQALCVAWNFPYVQGQADIEPTLTFVILSGFWTDPSGNSIPVF